MARTAAKRKADQGPPAFFDQLTEAEQQEFTTESGNVSNAGYILMDAEGETLASEGVGEESAAVFANLFDVSSALGEELGQSEHFTSTVENRGFEITCRRWSASRFVYLRSKGGNMIGG